MSDVLKLLTPKGRGLLTRDEFPRVGLADIEEFVVQFERPIYLEPLANVIAEAQRRFFDNPEASDAWLAPRVHDALRLSRREASDVRLWHFLSVRFREYIEWRWTGREGIAEVRVTGSTNRHAVARLWWGAELVRNGPDYALVSQAFALQETVQWLLDIEAFQNRPAALAYVGYLGDGVDGDRARSVAMTLNHALSTISLDALAPDLGSDREARERWIKGRVDETLSYSKLPDGPDDDTVANESIEAVQSLLRHLEPAAIAVRERTKERRRTRSRTRARSSGFSADAITHEPGSAAV